MIGNTIAVVSVRRARFTPARVRWLRTIFARQAMAARRTNLAKRSGPNIPDAHTRKVPLRVAPETDARCRALAREREETLSEVATRAIDLLDAQGGRPLAIALPLGDSGGEGEP